ncbi:MAG TPA: apolipoprotein N-acyltransferase [Burkholderiales bacterium]|nr:apolipoprotein N-acyltransferase [Burkholderiales bacterium]
MKAEGGRRNKISAAPRSSILRLFVLPFALGALSVAGFAPLRLFPLPLLALAALVLLWERAPGARAAGLAGLAFGLGLFLAGVSWVYVSLHDYGSMPASLAAAATLLFCLYLALFPAAVGWLSRALPLRCAARCALLVPALWTLAEWTRGWLFTGFPWLALGYSQIPESPLAGYAPVAGIHGVTLAAAATAGLLAVLWRRATGEGEGAGAGDAGGGGARGTALRLAPPALCLLALWLGGLWLAQVEWTRPAGAPFAASLVQGNVAQEMKWREERVQQTLEAYRTLVQSSSGRLIVLPETALPLFLDQVPRDYLAALAARARANGGDILIGVPERLPGGDYYNSMISLGTAPSQSYRKSHLVPFGEFIPLRPLLAGIVSVLAIPLQDFARGGAEQRPLAVAGERVAVNICYEDAFGEEIIRQLPEATLLVNASNVAWFGRSIAPAQHLQISQARALETGRYLLRATNTGVTAVIDPRGVVVARAPEFTAAIVTHPVRGYRGATPYVRWGNAAALALCALLLGIAAGLRAAERPGSL